MNDGKGAGAAALEDATTAQALSSQEVLKIRRRLTLYLASLITFPDDQPSHFQLCHPETALGVKHIPKQVIGLRRQYLKEIQANIKARQNYQDLLASTKSEIGSLTTDGDAVEGATRLETHLKLLQIRKRHKEVQITRHYLEKLRETNPAKDGGLDFGSRRVHEDEMSQAPSVEGGNGYGSHGESTKALMEKLERAVVTAKYQLEREKRLLAEVKALHVKDGLQDRLTDPGARLQALSATRDELVRFLEEKMSIASVEDDGVPAHVTEHGDEPRVDREQVLQQINAEYERYVAARKRVLEAAANALYISTEPGSEKAVSDKGIKTAENRPRAPPPATSQSPVSTLPFISERLLPLLRNQKATSLQKSYTAKIIKTERVKALDGLERLADESRLLPEYPIMARQERFTNVAAALGGPRQLDQSMIGSREDMGEMVRRAEAWAFAAEEAKKVEEDFVMEKVRYGNERLDGAGESLALLDQLLGGKPQDSELAGDGGSEADIWLEAAGGSTQNAQSRRVRPSQQEQGPWAGLHGKIGVVDGRKS
jgi:hypothetical protein